MRAAAAATLTLLLLLAPHALAQPQAGLSSLGIAMVGFRSVSYEPDSRTLTAELILVAPSTLTLETEELKTVKVVGAGPAVGQEIRLRARLSGGNATEYVVTVIPLRIVLDPSTRPGRFFFMIFVNGSPIAQLELDLERALGERAGTACLPPLALDVLQDRRTLSALLLAGAVAATTVYYLYRKRPSRVGEGEKGSANS